MPSQQPVVQVTVAGPGKDANAVVLNNAETGVSANTSVTANALASASAGSQAPKASVSSGGQSAGLPVKQVAAKNIGGVGTNFSNPA